MDKQELIKSLADMYKEQLDAAYAAQIRNPYSSYIDHERLKKRHEEKLAIFIQGLGRLAE